MKKTLSIFTLCFLIPLIVAAQKNSFAINEDLNNDGKVDHIIIETTPNEGSVDVYYALSNTPKNILLLKKVKNPVFFAIDLNFDSNHDLLISYGSNTERKTVVFKNNGKGQLIQLNEWWGGDISDIVRGTSSVTGEYIDLYLMIDNQEFKYRTLTGSDFRFDLMEVIKIE